MVRNRKVEKTSYNLCIAGTHSGAGKTTITLGLLAALKKRGLQVQPFKCGPDYIDPGHHKSACGTASRNLDAWMMGEAAVEKTFYRGMRNSDATVTEGVMGLYDGASATDLTGSTAHICKLLNIAVVLVVDARSMARSIAAVVKGFTEFEKGVNVVAVVANRVGSENHTRLLTEALEAAGQPPLAGAIPKNDELYTPERHLGLIAETESERSITWFDDLADLMEKHVDVPALLEICQQKRPMPYVWGGCVRSNTVAGNSGEKVRVGIARDKAFHFYYEDNLDVMRECGAELVSFSPLEGKALPEGIDGLYLGGGFPESFAKELSENGSMRQAIREFAERGGHIYAECGGFMYLCERLTDTDGNMHEMCGVLPAETQMENRLHRLGYVEATTLQDGLFGAAGTKLRGHEFHWSSSRVTGEAKPVFEVRFTRGNKTGKIGLCRKNVWGSYAHLHFASNPEACRSWLAAMDGE